MGSKRLKAVAVRASRGAPSPTRPRCSPRRRTCARARSARPPPSTASWARSPTCSRSTRSPRSPATTSGRRRRRSSLEDRAAVRDSCASCSIGCERIMKTKDGGSARVEYESAFALGPLVGIGDADAVLEASARCDELGVDTISTGGTIAWAMEAGVARLAALRRRRGRAPRDRADRRARGARRPARRGLARGLGAARAPRTSRCTSRASSCPATSRARCTRWRSGSRSTRAAPTTTARAPTRPTCPGELDRLDGGAAHVAAAIETEDRAAAMDSLILCKFLRGVFSDPWEEWAALLASRHRLGHRRRRAARHGPRHRRRQARVQPPRGLDARRGHAAGAAARRPAHAALRPRGGPHARAPRGDGRAYHRERGLDTFVQNRHPAACMALTVPPKTDAPTVTCTIDGIEVTVPSGTTIYTAAKQAGIEIPVLCHDERYDPVGVCRMCAVDIGGRVLAAACVRPCEDGMEVKTATPQVEQQRAVLTELLMADQPPPRGPEGDDHRRQPAARAGPPLRTGHAERLPQARGRGVDDSNPVIHVNHDACILCDRCVRACDDIQGNDVIGRSGKGYETRIAFDLNDPMGESTCVTCGECVAACPTGALVNKPIRDVPIRPRERAQVGRLRLPLLRRRLRAHLPRRRGARRDRVRRGPRAARQPERLCVKGRYGWDYAASPQRLTTPLIRVSLPEGRAARGDVKGEGRGRKRPGGIVDYDEVLPHFREATWEEALDLAALAPEGDPRAARPRRDRRLRLGEVLQRGGLPLPEADPRGLRHEQRRPLHAPVPRLERRRAARGRRLRRRLDDLRRHHQRRRRDPRGHEHDGQPPRRLLVLQAGQRRGTKLIVVDPRRERIADHADVFCQIKPGTDVAFYNGVLHEVIRLGLVDREFIARARDNYGELAELVQASTRPSARRRSAASTPTRSATSPGCGARRARASSTGAWGSPSTRRAPTTRAA